MRISDWSSDVCSSDLGESNKRMPSNPAIPAPSHAVAPATICLLRLSALGDATPVVPLVRTLRRAWPAVLLTWVIGKGEYGLQIGRDTCRERVLQYVGISVVAGSLKN